MTVTTHRVTGDHIAAPYRVMAGASILFAASLERAGWPAIVRQPARVTQEEENFCFKCLEPISKSFEEDDETGELHEAKEVLRIKLPADKNAALPLNPGEEPFD